MSVPAPMFPASLAVLVMALVLGALALAGYVWAWRHSQFDDLEQGARVILDEHDCRLERPWETPAQRAERTARYGEPLEPRPGEWGGAR